MGLFEIKAKTIRIKGEKKIIIKRFYTHEELEQFNPNILDIGKIGAKSQRIDSIAAIFDLSGFTKFCNQRDPHLCVPAFLSEFLDWLFKAIPTEMEGKEHEAGKAFNTELPFFAKFTGDGVLFLWDAADMDEVYRCNVLVFMRNTCIEYQRTFLAKTRDRYRAVPNKLRCAIARGDVYSIGDGKDFIGPCINIASRLLSYSGIMCCFANSGFDLKSGMVRSSIARYSVKKALLRGMGEAEELICVDEGDFEELDKNEKKLFTDVK